jgi:hypothetical protein
MSSLVRNSRVVLLIFIVSFLAQCANVLAYRHFKTGIVMRQIPGRRPALLHGVGSKKKLRTGLSFPIMLCAESASSNLPTGVPASKEVIVSPSTLRFEMDENFLTSFRCLLFCLSFFVSMPLALRTVPKSTVELFLPWFSALIMNIINSLFSGFGSVVDSFFSGFRSILDCSINDFRGVFDSSINGFRSIWMALSTASVVFWMAL